MNEATLKVIADHDASQRKIWVDFTRRVGAMGVFAAVLGILMVLWVGPWGCAPLVAAAYCLYSVRDIWLNCERHIRNFRQDCERLYS